MKAPSHNQRLTRNGYTLGFECHFCEKVTPKKTAEPQPIQGPPYAQHGPNEGPPIYFDQHNYRMKGIRRWVHVKDLKS